MRHLATTRRARLLAATLPLTLSLGLHTAHAAEDSLPGDACAQPLNVNLALVYNLFTNAGEVGAVHGGSYDKDTHISTDISVARYVRTFAVDGFVSGVQVYEPYVAFIGAQGAGVANIAGPYVPLLGGQLPAYGAGRANLSQNSGFGQPNFGVFSYLINRPESGTYAVVAPWISPPISGFNKAYNLNPGQNVWTYEFELGVRTTLFGDPAGQNLSMELWTESYFFGANRDSAYAAPEVSANHIPPVYGEYNLLSGGAIPDANPLQAASATPATFHEQPSQEFRVYLPYEFLPATRAFISPGFYQSMGGKQTYTLRDGVKVDSGDRTNESQLRLVAASFVSETTQIMLIGEYDVAAHGEPLNRNFEIRIARFF